jgi:hypothetical protein
VTVHQPPRDPWDPGVKASDVPAVKPVSLESVFPEVAEPAPTIFDPATGEVLESAPITNVLDIAKSYIQRGWNPVPVPFKSKVPIGEEWQKRIIDHSNVGKFFNGQPQNVGVAMGQSSGGLVDVDLD